MTAAQTTRPPVYTDPVTGRTWDFSEYDRHAGTSYTHISGEDVLETTPLDPEMLSAWARRELGVRKKEENR